MKFLKYFLAALLLVSVIGCGNSTPVSAVTLKGKYVIQVWYSSLEDYQDSHRQKWVVEEILLRKGKLYWKDTETQGWYHSDLTRGKWEITEVSNWEDQVNPN